VGIVIALCAVLLLKWLAVLALVVGGLVLLVRWLWHRHRPAARGAVLDDAPVIVPLPRSSEPDCTWCGLAGGHHDGYGRPVRPRHFHQVAPQRV
jgi:hypothetical protein